MTSFLDLPPELRNSIYDLALPQSNTYSITKAQNLPSLCRASHQVYSESAPIWYWRNKFILDDKDSESDTINIQLQDHVGLHRIHHFKYQLQWIVDLDESLFVMKIMLCVSNDTYSIMYPHPTRHGGRVDLREYGEQIALVKQKADGMLKGTKKLLGRRLERFEEDESYRDWRKKMLAGRVWDLSSRKVAEALKERQVRWKEVFGFPGGFYYR